MLLLDGFGRIKEEENVLGWCECARIGLSCLDEKMETLPSTKHIVEYKQTKHQWALHDKVFCQRFPGLFLVWYRKKKRSDFEAQVLRNYDSFFQISWLLIIFRTTKLQIICSVCSEQTHTNTQCWCDFSNSRIESCTI